jgi:hypothetical protein
MADPAATAPDDLEQELRRLEARLAATATAPHARVIDELSQKRRELVAPGERRRLPLANVRVASPCKQSWADMVGDDRVRVCAGCERPVFNLSEMTRAEAEAVLATRGITPCVRFYRRADGTVMTADCPTGARPKPPRLAGVAAGTMLLASSAALAEPAAPSSEVPAAETSVSPEGPAAEPTVNPCSGGNDTVEVLMGEMVAEPRHEHAMVEWSTWLRLGHGIKSRALNTLARGTTPPLSEMSAVNEAALAADVSMRVADRGNIRLGAWGEVRTTSGPVLGGELIVEGLPPRPYTSDFSGSGSVVLRVGGNAHAVTSTVGFGYVGFWGPSEYSRPVIRELVGFRVVASMTRSTDDPRDWCATFGVELEPIGVLRYAAGLLP